jgi:Fur family iron response transcriptional regulator
MLQMQQSFQCPKVQAVSTPLSRTIVFTNTVQGAEHSASPSPRATLTGCPWRDVKSMLRDVGLRPTRQRMALGWILFGKGDRHVTAEILYEEAVKAKVPVSLATVYNTLHQFTGVGLLRQVAVDGSKTYFDTNVSQHHHFFIEGENDLLDIPDADVVVGRTPIPPEGYEIARVDVVVRLRRKPR